MSYNKNLISSFSRLPQYAKPFQKDCWVMNVKKLAAHAPKPNRMHPLISTARPALAHVQTYLTTSRRLLRAAAPVHADVWL